jgi:hypothetical protein
MTEIQSRRPLRALMDVTRVLRTCTSTCIATMGIIDFYQITPIKKKPCRRLPFFELRVSKLPVLYQFHSLSFTKYRYCLGERGEKGSLLYKKQLIPCSIFFQFCVCSTRHIALSRLAIVIPEQLRFHISFLFSV